MKKFIIVLLITLFSVLLSGPLVFATGWIDLQSDTTYTAAQLEKRYDAHIRSEFPLRKERAMNRRAMGAVKGKYIPTAADAADEAAYEAHTKAVRESYEQALVDNELLKGVISYERAEQRLERYILSVGITAIAEVPEIRDPDTGELTQEYSPAIAGVNPLPATIEQVTRDAETGEITGSETVPNPLIVQDEAERQAAQNIIDNASAEILALITARAEQ